MKTIKIKVHLDTGFAGEGRRDVLEVEVEDDATEDEINEALDEACSEWAHNRIEFGYTIIE